MHHHPGPDAHQRPAPSKVGLAKEETLLLPLITVETHI
jgi:hypothetical protein